MMMMRDGPRYGFREGLDVAGKLQNSLKLFSRSRIMSTFFSAMFSIGAFVVLMTSTGGLGYFIGGGEELIC